MKFDSETELAKVVAGHIREQGWDLYYEVECLGSIADIVAVMDKCVWVIECKLSCSFELWGQAMHWMPHANVVSVAYPLPRAGTRKGTWLITSHLANHFGIGAFRVEKGGRINEFGKAVMRRRRTDKLSSVIRPEHMDYAEPGTASGKRWTPFQATCSEMRRVVTENEGISLRDAISQVKHHYATPASARCCLSKLIQQGVVEGIRAERDGRKIILRRNHG